MWLSHSTTTVLFGFQIRQSRPVAFARLAADGTWTSFTPQQPVSYLALWPWLPTEMPRCPQRPYLELVLQRIDPRAQSQNGISRVSMA